MEDALIETEGIEKGGIREDGHGIAFLVSDTSGYPIAGDYEIPVKYNADTIIILPVNEKKVYIYWELTEQLLIDKIQSSAAASFKVRIYEIPHARQIDYEKDYSEKEIYSTEVKGQYGQIFAECAAYFKPMTAAIGIKRDGVFHELLKSNQINVPSFRVLGLKEEFRSRGILHKWEQNEGEVIGQTETEIEVISRLLAMKSKDNEITGLLLRLIENIRYLSDEDKEALELIIGLFGSKDVRVLRLLIEFLRSLRIKGGGSGGSIMKLFGDFKEMSDSGGTISGSGINR
ncbi:MAG: DUF4912 domain-containing protein [Nitrospirae bacterium]|nr:DUF4912 domain-containing protein [Nitrospirota bacterium]